MDWATQEVARELREARATENALEKSVRDARLKDVRGRELFEQLRAWMDGQAKSYNEQKQRQVLEVGEIKASGGIEDSLFFQVSDRTRVRGPMKISYIPAAHTITVECGAGPKRYSLIIGDSGDILFENPNHQPRTIEELGAELMTHWRTSQF
jgi:hypothetical protein